MQNLEIISVNLWQILISLCNLLLLFFILKWFLYKPVKNALAKRQAAIDAEYTAAEEAKECALADKEIWNERMKNAKLETDAIIKKATADADKRSAQIIAAAKEKANEIVQNAEADAELERKKASSEIKQEIVDVSAMIAEKLLSREINDDDHHRLVDSFIREIGESDDADE